MMQFLVQAGDQAVWLLTWQIVVIVSLIAFGVMSLVVGTGGIRDLFSMFRDLSGDNDAEEEQPPAPS